MVWIQFNLGLFSITVCEPLNYTNQQTILPCIQVLHQHSKWVNLSMLTAPSAAPTSVHVSVANSTTISVQWEMVPCIDCNGDIIGYSVRYTRGGSVPQNMSVSGDSSGGMVTISGLSPATMYTVEVAAVNSADTGVYSSPVMVTTPDSKWSHTHTW